MALQDYYEPSTVIKVILNLTLEPKAFVDYYYILERFVGNTTRYQW